MEPTQPVDFQIPEQPFPPSLCPISELVGKRVTEMTDAELDAHVQELRSAVESPQSLRKMVANSGGKTKKAAKIKVDLSLLGL